MNKKQYDQQDSMGYEGVIAAMITPCCKPGVPCIDETVKFARILSERGCHGLFVLGSTGELPLLDEGQRRQIVAAARQGACSDTKIYAGISGTGVKQVIRHAANAAEDGADVAIAMAPFFLKFDQAELYEYVVEIADSSPIPVGIYNHLRMPSIFEADTLLRLAQHPNLVALKDTSAELSQGIRLAKSLNGTSLSFFQGREVFLLETFRVRASGCVTALANIVPEWHRRLYDAVKSDDHQTAIDMQEKILSLSRIFDLNDIKLSFAHFTYALRYAAQQRGWLESTHGMISGFEPSDEFTQSVASILQECGLNEEAGCCQL